MLVEVQDDAPIWRIRVQAEGGTREQIYSLDGELRQSTSP